MIGRILLVRHPPVAKAWAGRCYGRSDMGWSREGYRMGRDLAERLASEPVTAIVHSGAVRTRRLAEKVAKRTGISSRTDPRWLERDFGTWEGRTWDSIWRETGSLMDKMMTHPASFKPGGGETGTELMARVSNAWGALDKEGLVLVITHGGPIAALRTLFAGHTLDDMARFIPSHGEIITLLERPNGIATTA